MEGKPGAANRPLADPEITEKDYLSVYRRRFSVGYRRLDITTTARGQGDEIYSGCQTLTCDSCLDSHRYTLIVPRAVARPTAFKQFSSKTANSYFQSDPYRRLSKLDRVVTSACRRFVLNLACEIYVMGSVPSSEQIHGFRLKKLVSFSGTLSEDRESNSAHSNT